MTRYEHVCQECSAAFKSVRPLAKWCGTTCKSRASYRRVRERKGGVVSTRFTRSRFDAISASGTRYTEADIVAALQDCAAELGATPSYEKYDAWSRGRPVCSPARVVQRFGRWRLALAEAGLDREGRRGTLPNHRRIFDEAACVAALRDCALAVGQIPTYRDYQVFTKGHAGAPSEGTIRNTLASRWLDCLGMSFPENPNVSVPE